MKEFDYGILGFMLGWGAFCLGIMAGKKAHPTGRRSDPPSAETDGMEEEQKAFRALTGYSADIAYGSAPFFPEADA